MGKIYKQQARSITKMTTEEIQRVLKSPEIDMPTKEAIVQEGLNKLSEKTFLIVAISPELLMNPKIYEYSLNFLEKNQAPSSSEKLGTYIGLFSALLNSDISNNFSNRLLPLSLRTPLTSAIALMKEGTPNNVINGIINMNRLNIPSHSTIKQPILAKIIDLITNTNIKWDNSQSSLVLLTRILQNPSDMFIIAASKANLGFNAASNFLSAGKHYSSDVVSGLKNNVTNGVRMAFGLNDLAENGINTKNLDDVIELTKASSSEYVKNIWELVENSINNFTALTGGKEDDTVGEPILFHQIFTHTLNGESLIEVMIDKNPTIIEKIINAVKKSNSAEMVLRTRAFAKLIHIGLLNASTKDLILSMPEEWFSFVSMTPNDRITVSEYFHPKQQNATNTNEELENLENLMGFKNNWYKKYSSE